MIWKRKHRALWRGFCWHQEPGCVRSWSRGKGQKCNTCLSPVKPEHSSAVGKHAGVSALWCASSKPAPHCDQGLVHGLSYPLGLCRGRKKTHILPSRLQKLGWDWWSEHSLLQRDLGLLRPCAQQGLHRQQLGPSCCTWASLLPSLPWAGIECMYVTGNMQVLSIETAGQ